MRALVPMALHWHPEALALTGDGGLLWLAASAVGWMVIGATAFHLGDTAARRDGTLTRA